MAMMCVANEQLQQIVPPPFLCCQPLILPVQIEKLSDENFLDFVNQFCGTSYIVTRTAAC